MKRIIATAMTVAMFTISATASAQQSAPDSAPITPDASLPILLSETELATTRGGQTLIINNQTLKAITSGNVIGGDYVAGDISFSDNAFANFAGIGNFTINTGAQNNLQTAMILTVNVTN
ncbi:hypothetical protein [Sphingomonas sp. AX6]|uniref:hypothetical protein n=1 Tax=Sphingomonas sp. AX6 TaxID=2653171 RepID=UPI0012F2F59C|nr:hypothetical protein [Sphingomonas sp. AX6]VXC91263.1 Flagellar hook-length control protein fliK [Sphingomonas sp. AX6]